MANNELKQSVLVNLRCVTQSCKGGVLLSQLQNDYRDLIGKTIPFNELGYTTLELFLRDIPNVVSIRKNINGQLIAEAVADKSTAHIAKLISKQKGSSKPAKAKSKKPSVVTRTWGFAKRASLENQKVLQHPNTKSHKSVTPVVNNLVTSYGNTASNSVATGEISLPNCAPKKKKKVRRRKRSKLLQLNQEQGSNSVTQFNQVVPEDLTFKRSENMSATVPTLVSQFHNLNITQVSPKPPNQSATPQPAKKSATPTKLNPNSYFYRSPQTDPETRNSPIAQSYSRPKVNKEIAGRLIGKALGLKSATPKKTISSTASGNLQVTIKTETKKAVSVTPSYFHHDDRTNCDTFLPPPVYRTPLYSDFASSDGCNSSASSSQNWCLQGSSGDDNFPSSPSSGSTMISPNQQTKYVRRKLNLKENPKFKKNLDNADISSLLHLYFFFFGCYDVDTIKKQILLFSGFTFSEETKKWKQRRNFLLRLPPSTIKNCLNVLCIESDSNDSKAVMVDKFMRHLCGFKKVPVEKTS